QVDAQVPLGPEGQAEPLPGETDRFGQVPGPVPPGVGLVTFHGAANPPFPGSPPGERTYGPPPPASGGRGPAGEAGRAPRGRPPPARGCGQRLRPAGRCARGRGPRRPARAGPRRRGWAPPVPVPARGRRGRRWARLPAGTGR